MGKVHVVSVTDAGKVDVGKNQVRRNGCHHAPTYVARASIGQCCIVSAAHGAANLEWPATEGVCRQRQMFPAQIVVLCQHVAEAGWIPELPVRVCENGVVAAECSQDWRGSVCVDQVDCVEPAGCQQRCLSGCCGGRTICIDDRQGAGIRANGGQHGDEHSMNSNFPHARRLTPVIRRNKAIHHSPVGACGNPDRPPNQDLSRLRPTSRTVRLTPPCRITWNQTGGPARRNRGQNRSDRVCFPATCWEFHHRCRLLPHSPQLPATRSEEHTSEL